MAKSKKIQNLPNIQWNENEHSRIWKLIAEISAKANYKVLFGKKINMRWVWISESLVLICRAIRTHLARWRPAFINGLVLLSYQSAMRMIQWQPVTMSRANLNHCVAYCCFCFADFHFLILDSPKPTRNMPLNSEWQGKVSVKNRTMTAMIPTNFASFTLVWMALIPIAQRKPRIYGVCFFELWVWCHSHC